MNIIHAEIDRIMKEEESPHDTGNYINGEPEYDCVYDDASIYINDDSEELVE